MIRLTVFAFVALSLPTPTVACSLMPDYRAPTNFELAQESDLILLGRVIGDTSESDLADPSLLVTPVETIKGVTLAETISLPNMRLDYPIELGGRGQLSNPYELSKAHPDAYSGACQRRVFPLGTTVLFFLERSGSDDSWRSSGDAFSRWAEDVLTEDAPWLQLAGLYTEVAALPESEHLGVLEAERSRFIARVDDPVAKLMAADMARQIDGLIVKLSENTERDLASPGLRFDN